MLKIQLHNLNDLDKSHYIKFLELEENRIYNVTEYNDIYYSINEDIKKGLWIEKRVCKITD